MSKPLWVNSLWGPCEPELNSGCSVHFLQQKMLKPTPVSTARWIFGVPASIIALCHHSILHNWHGVWHNFVRRGQQNLQQRQEPPALAPAHDGPQGLASRNRHGWWVCLSIRALFQYQHLPFSMSKHFFCLFVRPSERKVSCRFIFVLFLLLYVTLRFARFVLNSQFFLGQPVPKTLQDELCCSGSALEHLLAANLLLEKTADGS